MKKIAVLISLMIALISIACQSSVLAERVETQKTLIDPELIKSASLLIVVEKDLGTRILRANAMASLVMVRDKTYLVTHNHWDDMLADMNKLELRNADSELIQRMDCAEFKNLIVYQDAGTIVLNAPDGLLDAFTPGNLAYNSQLHKGDTVQVAHRSYPNRDRVEILEAVVENIGVFNEAPVYILRGVRGSQLRPGDSGGGVWHNGKLVANTWTVNPEYRYADASGNVDLASESLTDLSMAAVSPGALK
jgi:hypothetical protein